MRKFLKKWTIFSLVVLVFGSLSAKNKPEASRFKIVQDGKIISVKDNSVLLDKETFQLVFTLKHEEGVLVHASFNPYTFNEVSNGVLVDDIETLGMGMAAGLYNPSESLVVEDSAPSYWFYDSEDEHRFDSYMELRDSMECIRTVSNLENIEDESLMSIQKVNRPLYLVIVSSFFEVDVETEVKEVMSYLKIDWR
ncbi:hypothetical protein [Myroides guanonis]|uniref:Uncharacterized protein n=1 Tax=Myroides guanonis TaxID=1150112 RepID=A0A1I3UWV5_9FLAO|nr:hypothetical protein [Myroides guanonis]SFJ87390.1 hypothetical protein SAMN04487893_12029 [Myroides guanonis]